jgi:ADP-ribosylation factor GTPase-activating protein 2/3
VKKLGYDTKAEQQAQESKAAFKPNEVKPSTSSTNAPDNSAKNVAQDERLGMGFRKLGFGQTFGLSGEEAASMAEKQKRAAAKAASGYVEPETGTVARERFGNQKGKHFIFAVSPQSKDPKQNRMEKKINRIFANKTTVAISSDMFFERNDYDAQASTEAKTRLTQFSGATAISSNQYFGREDQNEMLDQAQESILGVDGLQGLEQGARELAKSAMKAAGYNNINELQDGLRSGAMKVRPPPF